jgi:hypothetical protein
MDKMFYSLEEAAAKLGKSEAEVRDMAAKGQLSEFRDRDRLMFKREQVDLLSGGGDDDVIPLAESGELEALSLAESGTGISLEPPKDSTGINIFEADSTDESDPSAVTRITSSPSGPLVDPGDKSASGSGGLLDLTREADDTSLGEGLLEDVYGSETVAQQTAVDSPGAGVGGDALFESPGAEVTDPGAAAGMAMMVAAEPYDGPGSGLVGGVALGVVVAAAIAAFTVIIGMTSTAGGGLLATIGDSYMILLGVMLLVPVLGALIGFFMGKRS